MSLIPLFLYAQQPSDNLLVNGSFEEGTAVGLFKILKEGDVIPGWKVTKATVDLTGNYFNCVEGEQSIDLNGTPGFGAIEQQFLTEKGKKYQLSFYLAGNPSGEPQIKKMLVSVGNEIKEYQFDINGKTPTEMGWEYNELIFKAKSKETILKFESNHKSGPTNWGPAIDNVRIVIFNNSGEHSGDSSSNNFRFRFGVLAGTSYYYLDENDLIIVKNVDQDKYNIQIKNAKLGIHFGIMTQLRINHFILRPEAIFNFNVINNYHIEDIENYSVKSVAKEKYLYLDIPILFGYKKGALRMMGGPVGYIFIFNSSDLLQTENIIQTFKPFTIGWQTGLGFDLFNFMLDIRYEGNFDRLGDGIIFIGKKIYFSTTPNRIIATLTFAIK